MPALVTRISTGPSSARTRSTPASTDGRSATSTSRARTFVPSASSSAAAVSSVAGFTSKRATRWPSAPNRRATPRPMPDDATGDDGDPAHELGLDGVELEVQLGEAAEDPRRLVAEAPVTGRAVVLLGQADVAHPVEDPFEADPALGPGQRPTGARVGATAEGDVGLGVGPVGVELGGALEPPGSRLAAPLSSMTGVPAGMSTPPNVVVRRARRKSAFTGLSIRSTSSRKSGIRSRSARSSSCSVGVLGEHLEGGGEQAGGGLLPGGEQERRRAHHRGDVRGAAVRVGGEGQIGHDVLAGLAPPVLDVGREPVVEPGQRVLDRDALLAGPDLADGAGQAEPVAEPLMVLLGDAEQIGDGEHGERLGVGGDELAAAVGQEGVELLVGQPPHERLVVLEALRGDQPHQQAPFPGVVRAGPW